MATSFTCRARVRYGETDKMGIAYYGRYVDWFEMGRTELCRSAGKSFVQWEAEGFLLPVVEAHCRYKSSLHYDDIFEVETSITDLTKVSVTFTCRVFKITSDDKTGETRTLAAEGYTKHAFMKDGKLARHGNELEAWLREFLTSGL